MNTQNMNECCTPVTPATSKRDQVRYTPTVDVLESDSEVTLVAEVPGAAADGFDVQVDKGVLTLNARVTPRDVGRNARFLLREYGVGDYARSFRMGDGIDTEAITAEYAAGVLTVHLPKRDTARTKKISVRAN